MSVLELQPPEREPWYNDEEHKETIRLAMRSRHPRQAVHMSASSHEGCSETQ